ncbi:MAG: flavodoxin [Clostridia bacterium]|nr:flavodoxin [Clostridia bacterium]
MKTLIVYYTYTGHTKMIAEKIRKVLNCDILELEMKEPYPKDYDYVVDIAQTQAYEKYTPELKEFDKNIDEYDKIILGMPVWWYTFAPAIRTFLIKTNLKGKVIIPFATNAGWLGHTLEDVKTLCKEAKVEHEMDICFTQDYLENKLVTSEKIIDEWIETLK